MVENKNKKVLNAPHLRFPEFSGEWVECKFGDIAPLQRGFDLPKHQLEDGTFPVVYSNGIMNYHSSYKCTAPGLVTGRSGTIGKFTFVSNGYYWPHNTSLWVTDFNGNIPEFVYYLYQTINIEQYATGSGVPTLNRNDVHRHKVYVPQTKEQSKIARLLMLLDERIATQNKVIEDLKKLKSAIAERVYNCRTYQLYRIGDVIEQVSKRNNSMSIDKVLSVSNKLGFINQSEQFEDRIVASEDTSNYKIVYKDDFAYNPARINVGSIARLKHFNKGIVSPMYICFRVKQGIVLDYLEYFFTTNYFFNEMQKRLEGSVRQCLSFEGLCNIPIYIPNLYEQQKMGRKVSVIMEKIDNENRYLDSLKMQKKYLLRQMFI